MVSLFRKLLELVAIFSIVNSVCCGACGSVLDGLAAAARLFPSFALWHMSASRTTPHSERNADPVLYWARMPTCSHEISAETRDSAPSRGRRRVLRARRSQRRRGRDHQQGRLTRQQERRRASLHRAAARNAGIAGRGRRFVAGRAGRGQHLPLAVVLEHDDSATSATSRIRPFARRRRISSALTLVWRDDRSRIWPSQRHNPRGSRTMWCTTNSVTAAQRMISWSRGIVATSAATASLTLMSLSPCHQRPR